MRIKTRIKLLVLLIVCMATALIAGCSVGEETLQEYLDRNGAAGQCVTYYGNGGIFNDNNSKTQVDVYYKPDSYIIASEQKEFYVTRQFFNFDAWYYGQVDGEGNPVLDSNGNLVLTDKKLGENEKISEGVHIYVGAKWNSNVALEVYLVTDGFNLKTSDGTEYKTGDKIKTSDFGSATVYGLSERRDSVTASNATFLSFFEDAECTKPIVTVNKPDDVNAENVKVYVKYLEGKWSVVKTSTDVSNMFNNSSNGASYYLFTADGSNEINCSGTTISLNPDVFNINIVGNGVTVKGLKFSSSGIGGGSYSVFGKFAAQAKISDFTLKNVEVTVTVKSDLNLYLISHGDDGADISGLTVQDISLTITSSSLIDNIQNNSTENWLFGGYGTDDDYIEAKEGGISVVNASLTLNGENIASNISK